MRETIKIINKGAEAAAPRADESNKQLVFKICLHRSRILLEK